MYMLIVCFLVGAGLVAYSAICFRRQPQDTEDASALRARMAETLDELGQSISEAHRTLPDSDSQTRAILREIDDKYGELLSLCDMLDQKKLGQAAPISRHSRDHARRRLQNLRSQDILKMHESGLGLSEIAKKMRMGKSEVSIILESGKDVERNA